MPEHYDSYVGIDLGLNDHTAILFAYYNFLDRSLVIEDEWVSNGKNTKEIVEAAKRREMQLFPKTVYKRIADNEIQQLYDMQTMFNYYVEPTQKDDKLSAVNALRLRFTQRRIKIKKRCVNLRYQLKVGSWNDKRTSFMRGDKIGHLDTIDAAVYLNRGIVESRNPYPDLSGGHITTHYIPVKDLPENKNQDVAKAFEFDMGTEAPFDGSTIF